MSDEKRDNDDQYAGTGFFDDLTWLPSRLLFRDRAEQAIAWADRHGARMAVLFVAIEDFDGIRSQIGSDAADGVLRDLGNRLVAALRREDSVARTRLDEYAILLPEVDTEASTGLVGQKVLQVFEKPFDPSGANQQLGASVGAAVYPDHALTIEGLLIAADAALQHAQSNRPGEVVVYAGGMTRRQEGDAGARG